MSHEVTWEGRTPVPDSSAVQVLTSWAGKAQVQRGHWLGTEPLSCGSSAPGLRGNPRPFYCHLPYN